QQVRRPGRGVADDNHVYAHRLDVLGRVDERLALADARPAGREVDRVGPESAGGQAEAGAGAGGRFIEDVGDDLALEVVAFRRAALADADVAVRPVEDQFDLAAGKVFQAEQMFAGPG